MKPFIRVVYGCYAWVMLAAFSLPTAALLTVTPRTDWCRRIARTAARGFFATIGSPIRVVGDPEQARARCIVVANHASYLDGIILTAALPASFTFVIKHEMAAIPLASLILRRLGSEFVRRENGAHRQRVARRLLAAAQTGAALALFPEATFDARPGLRPFHAGAFAVARRTGTPLVPVVIHGARSMLGAGAWLLTPGRLTVSICEPLHPGAYPCAGTLMAAARQRILEQLPEPDLLASTDALSHRDPALE
jgi:1-acyl-sn-glycerol-3-phosphate acyltransferase